MNAINKIVLVTVLLISSNAYSFGVINGPNRVAQNSTHNYTVYFSSSMVASAITWTGFGATVVSTGTFSATIQFSNTVNQPFIKATNNISGEVATFYIYVGYPDVSPLTQQVVYGSTATLSVVWPGGIVPSGNLQYQWYEYAGGSSYYPVSNATNPTFSPIMFYNKTYRCTVSISGGYPYPTPNASINIINFNAGGISIQQQPVYNTIVQLTTTPATGGPCNAPSEYVYQWERSVEGGPWEIVGNGESSPFNNQPIKGKWQVRRKIICGATSLYSNTIDIIPTGYVFADLEDKNYIREFNIVAKGYKSLYEVDQLPIGKKFVNTTYFDGIGRPTQTIEKGVSFVSATSSWSDLVYHIEYDQEGRTTKTFMPFSSSSEIGKYKTDASNAHASYITQTYNDEKGYSLVQYDNSPLNRAIKQYGPGANWINNDKGISFNYESNNFNSLIENIRIWKIDFLTGSIPYSNIDDVYEPGKLFKTISINENGKKTIEYNDLNGNVLLRKVQEKEVGQGLTDQHSGWASTYFVYDDFNQLRFIITPKAVEWLDENNWNLASNPIIANELCYSYEYDSHGRNIVKKVPGAEPVLFVYDNKNRLVFSQDGKQKTNSKWIVTLYDGLDRPVITGDINYSGSRIDLQQYVSTIVTDGTISQLLSTNAGVTNHAIDINLNPLPQNSNLYIHAINYYDSYNYPQVKPFSSNFQFDNTVPTDEFEQIETTNLSTDLITGTFVRIMDASDKFLLSTQFYDKKMRLIQTQADNVFGLNDITTVQYDYGGKKRSTHTSHTATLQTIPSLITTPVQIYSKVYFDQIGRVIKLSENLNNNSEKTLVEYSYNTEGKMTKKRLAPGFAGEDGPELETLEYTYNIRGMLTGINKNYTNSISQTGRYFGMELSYDVIGMNFTKQEWNGNISGFKWKTRGNNIERRYEYTYDNLNQLKSATFKQKNTSGSQWTSDKADFTTQVSYFSNGNIESINQFGVVPGIGVVQIDQLNYVYANNNYSNRLLRIDDAISGAWNGKLGDFKNQPATIGATQYFYDVNGNLSKDLNKQIDGITSGGDGIEYNIMGLPSKVSFSGSNKSITYVYNGLGDKIKKIYSDPTTSGPIETIYNGAFVYEKGILQFFSHPEGRVRIITSAIENNGLSYLNGGISLAGGKQAIYDYYIQDHLSNIRMILTEEQHQLYVKATMEDANSGFEESRFGQQPQAQNELYLSRTDKSQAPGWTSNTSLKVSKLSSFSGGKKIGPNVLVKVMAGDIVSSKSLYYYEQPSSSGSSVINEVIGTIIGALFSSSQASSIVKDSRGLIGSNLQSSTNPFNSFISQQPNYAIPNQPKAFLNVLFFDEQFNFVEDNSTSVPVAGSGMNGSESRYFNFIKQAPQNGYAIVYLSNESPVNVYFDDFEVTHTRGRIIEENHYYPYGLKIAGISSKAGIGFPTGSINSSRVKYGYQSNFSEEDTEIQWNEFALRTYDPQIGRWLQVDPEDIFASPYIGMGNNPTSTVDPLGATPFDWFKNSVGHMMWHSSTDRAIIDGGELWVNYGSELFVPGVVGDGEVGWNHYMGMGKVEFIKAPPQAALDLSVLTDNVKLDLPPQVQSRGDIRSFSPLIINPFAKAQPSQTISAPASVPPYQGRQQAAYSKRMMDVYNDKQGNYADGTPKPLTRLANNKYFQNFSNNIAEPMMSMAPIGGAAGYLFKVEQYSLRAVKSGFYPVMKRGFRKPQELGWLDEEEIWKFGTTRNPLKRYTQMFYNKTGEGLRYEREFRGAGWEAIELQNLKILNFKHQNGFLPFGNKVVN